MRAGLFTVAVAALLMGCAGSSKPPAKAAESPPGATKQNQDQPPPAAPVAEKRLSSKIPPGWARIPPTLVGAPQRTDAVFMNPLRHGMILVDLYKTGTKSAAKEAQDSMSVFKRALDGKWSVLKTSPDGNRASAVWTGKTQPGKSDRGMIVVRHLPKTADTPDLMVECIGMWQKDSAADNAKDLDALADSFAFR